LQVLASFVVSELAGLTKELGFSVVVVRDPFGVVVENTEGCARGTRASVAAASVDNGGTGWVVRYPALPVIGHVNSYAAVRLVIAAGALVKLTGFDRVPANAIAVVVRET
jgi:hypothetical protein